MNGEFYLERIWFASGIFLVPHAHQRSIRLLQTLAWILLLILLLLSGAARGLSLSAVCFFAFGAEGVCLSGKRGFGARSASVVVALAVIKYIKIKVNFYSCSVASFCVVGLWFLVAACWWGFFCGSFVSSSLLASAVVEILVVLGFRSLFCFGLNFLAGVLIPFVLLFCSSLWYLFLLFALLFFFFFFFFPLLFGGGVCLRGFIDVFGSVFFVAYGLL
jgi:hypothetical protein